MGVSVFRVSTTGELTHVDSVADSENSAYQLDGARSVTTAVVGSSTYLFVAGLIDDGVSVFSVSTTGELTHADSVDDSENSAYQLDGARSVTTAEVGSSTYLFVAGSGRRWSKRLQRIYHRRIDPCRQRGRQRE